MVVSCGLPVSHSQTAFQEASYAILHPPFGRCYGETPQTFSLAVFFSPPHIPRRSAQVDQVLPPDSAEQREKTGRNGSRAICLFNGAEFLHHGEAPTKRHGGGGFRMPRVAARAFPRRIKKKQKTPPSTAAFAPPPPAPHSISTTAAALSPTPPPFLWHFCGEEREERRRGRKEARPVTEVGRRRGTGASSSFQRGEEQAALGLDGSERGGGGSCFFGRRWPSGEKGTRAGSWSSAPMQPTSITGTGG